MFNFSINLIRFINISYISIIQFSFAIITNILLDKFLLPESEPIEDNSNVFVDFIVLCLIIALLVTISHVGKYFISKIPSPFYNILKEQKETKDLINIAALTSFLLLTSGIVERRISSIRNYFGLNTNFTNIEKKDQDNALTINK
jgi:uncharacterized protein involved in cysteine biosynthesis